MKKGIDVSKWQGDIDFARVKASGISFVIIRAGYGNQTSQKDEKFEQNYSKAKAANLDVGAYWYSYADSVASAKEEASACLSVIRGKQFEYPIYFDLEEKKQFERGRDFCDSLVRTFCGKMEEDKYFAGLYCSTYCLKNYISKEVAERYALWVAEYNNRCTYSASEYGMWQYSPNGSVDGIKENVDMDYCYVDYPNIIKSGGFNGYRL